MLSTTKVPLKYLFHVQYYDGGGFIQNKEDVSRVDPTRSAYFDVEQDKVEYFELIDPIQEESVLILNLDTGEFTINGKLVEYWEEYNAGDSGPKPYNLIFWRQHKHDFNVGLDEISHTVKYILGYSDADGIEHTITIE